MPKPLCNILFNNEFATYYAGKKLDGTVQIRNHERKKIQGIRIRLLGEGQVKWSESSSSTNLDGQSETSTNIFTKKQEYLQVHYHLQKNQGNSYYLGRGDHKFPFTFVLPPELPTSFEGQYGFVRYTIKVTIERSWKFDHEYKFPVTVLEHFDLNRIPAVKDKMEKTVTERFSCSCGGPLTIIATLPYSGFVPGQKIPIRLDCDNASRRNITSLELKLWRIEKYYARGKTKTVKNLLVSGESNYQIAARGSETIRATLKVPPTPPSELRNCKIIDIDYKLKIIAVDSWRRTVKLKLPIIIGTIPLSFAQAGNEVRRNEAPTAIQFPPENPVLDYNLPPHLHPPTYQESQQAATNLRSSDESKHMEVLDKYCPRYPVYQVDPNKWFQSPSEVEQSPRY